MRLMFVYICFSDVYLCAVLICLVGLLCMCMFTVTVTCQYIQRRQRLKGMQHHKDNTHLILTTVLFLYHSSCFLLKLDTSCISLSFCYCVSNRVVSVQIITFWSKALTTGKCLRVTKPHTQSWEQPKWALLKLHSAPDNLLSIQLRRDSHQWDQRVSCSAQEGEEIQEKKEQRLPRWDTTRDTSKRSIWVSGSRIYLP